MITGATIGIQSADSRRHWAGSGRLQLMSDPWMWRICRESVTVARRGQSVGADGPSGDLLS